ncbi:MAG TPA: DUF2076 domain-containing protein [Pseudolabrys sp.]|nr:DUF2076 domain-containing protein [Pseudolabrys sp.]
MTPQERQMIDDLFDRLAKLETAPRDPDAEHAIIEGLRRAPNAAYALVQTALVQDEALKRADAKINELSGEGQPQQAQGSSFLDSMRNAFTANARTSVPSVHTPPASAGGPDPRWNQGGTAQSAPNYQSGPQQGYAPGYAPSPGLFGGGGSSFLGTAAASAAGMIGGSLLLNSISSMFGHHASAFGAYNDQPLASSPWDNSAAGSSLAQDAGLKDIGNQQGAFDNQQSAGLFDNSNDPGNADIGNDFGDDMGSDGGDFGGGDTA